MVPEVQGLQVDSVQFHCIKVIIQNYTRRGFSIEHAAVIANYILQTNVMSR